MRKLRISLIIAAVFSFLIGIEACQSSKSATSAKMLKFNFEKGKGYDYEMNIDMDQEIMGSSTKLGIATYYSMDVMEDDGKVKVLQARYDRFKMDMDLFGMKLNVDTEKPVDTAGASKDPMQMISRLFGAIKGKQFRMKVDAEGKVLEINGFKEIAESIISSMELDAEDQKEVRGKMETQFDQQFNDQNIREQFERVLYIFPNKEVKVGDSWQKSSNMNSKMSGKMNSTYKVTEIEGDMVTLEEKTKIVSADDAMEVEGEQNGILVVDSRTGLVVTADLVMDMTAKAGGMSIDVKAKTKIKGKAR